jgi:hypothetical protein
VDHGITHTGIGVSSKPAARAPDFRREFLFPDGNQPTLRDEFFSVDLFAVPAIRKESHMEKVFRYSFRFIARSDSGRVRARLASARKQGRRRVEGWRG